MDIFKHHGIFKCTFTIQVIFHIIYFLFHFKISQMSQNLMKTSLDWQTANWMFESLCQNFETLNITLLNKTAFGMRFLQVDIIFFYLGSICLNKWFLAVWLATVNLVSFSNVPIIPKRCHREISRTCSHNAIPYLLSQHWTPCSQLSDILYKVYPVVVNLWYIRITEFCRFFWTNI